VCEKKKLRFGVQGVAPLVKVMADETNCFEKDYRHWNGMCGMHYAHIVEWETKPVKRVLFGLMNDNKWKAG